MYVSQNKFYATWVKINTAYIRWCRSFITETYCPDICWSPPRDATLGHLSSLFAEMVLRLRPTSLSYDKLTMSVQAFLNAVKILTIVFLLKHELMESLEWIYITSHAAMIHTIIPFVRILPNCCHGLHETPQTVLRVHINNCILKWVSVDEEVCQGNTRET